MISVLDHGYVSLVGTMGTDESIIEAARMSTNRGFEGWVRDARLLEYLYRNQHSTPFEMCELAIEVQAPLFVIREWQRHRTFSYNEASARYAKMPDVHYVPDKIRMVKQSSSNHQGSSEEPLRVDMAEDFVNGIRREQEASYSRYETMLEYGLVREVARVNTPVSRYSKMRVKGNLRNWLHFLNLRMRDNAQYEIRVYAHAISDIIAEYWPRTYALFEEYDLHGVRLSRTEAEAWKKSKA